MPRIANLIKYNKRLTNVKKEKGKIFFALEGLETEKRYLSELLDKCQSKNFEFRYFYREKSSGSSNLKNIVDDVINLKKEFSITNYTYDSLTDDIFYQLRSRNIIFEENKIISQIAKVAKNNNKRTNDEVTEDIMLSIKKIISFVILESELIDEILNSIKNDSSYDPDIDEICVVGDRDYHSFITEQYNKVVEECEKNNINLYISNPCIEFWFLLHFKDCKTYDKEILSINAKDTPNSKTFVEKELSQITFKEIKNILNISKDELAELFNNKKLLDDSYQESEVGYSKTAYNVSVLLKLTENAIRNASLYESNLKKLECNVGTNLPELIEKIKHSWS